jgi:putative membrane protein
VVVVALALAVGFAYGLRARSLRRHGRGLPGWRQACFYGGVALIAAALSPPMDEAAEDVFYMHMVQHLAIGDLAPLVLLLGLSGPVLRHVLAQPGVRRLRWLAHPLVALPLWAIVFYAWHLPALYEAALGNAAVHALEHLCFLSAGLAMWAAVLEPIPGPAWFGSGAKAGYVLAVRTLSAILANVFIWAGTPLYPGYAAGERAWGLSPLADQRIGGGIMLVEGALVTAVVFAWLFLRWAREAELRQSLLDAGASPRAASRAARFRRRAAALPESPPAPSGQGRSAT